MFKIRFLIDWENLSSYVPGGNCGASALPQFEQNLLPSGFGLPQLLQNISSAPLSRFETLIYSCLVYHRKYCCQGTKTCQMRAQTYILPFSAAVLGPRWPPGGYTSSPCLAMGMHSLLWEIRWPYKDGTHLQTTCATYNWREVRNSILTYAENVSIIHFESEIMSCCTPHDFE